MLKEAQHAGLFGARSGGRLTALTFTCAAMRELRDRLASRVGDDGLAGFDIRTFHSLATTSVSSS